MTGPRLAVGDAAVVVDPATGGRIASWTLAGVELLAHHGDAPEEWGMYAMAPWPGRLRGNAIHRDGTTYPLPATFAGWAMHGTVLAAPAEVVDLVTAPESARLELVTPLGPTWPWSGAVRQVVELTADRLRTTIIVESDAATFPAEVGWHPWFRRSLDAGGPAEVGLPATGILQRGADHLPTGAVLDPATVPGPYDDAFVVPDGRASITWPGALRLDVAADVGWYVLFDQQPDAVCLEPQSGPPDGMGPGAATASPGSPRSATATWTWSPA